MSAVMPMKVTNPLTSGRDAYATPFVGPIDYTAPLIVDIGVLTDDEVDADGYLKPGVLLTSSGTLVGTSGVVFGATIEAMKVAAGNSSAQLTAAGSQTVIVATHGQLNRDIMEDILGRSLTANEIAGLPAGHSLTLIA